MIGLAPPQILADWSLLLVHDEPALGAMKSALAEAGYLVDAYDDVEEAQRFIRQYSIALVIVNLCMRRGSALDLIREIGPPRGRKSDTAVIALGRDEPPSAIVEVLELGATDYIRVPFAFEELVARMAAIRRWQAAAQKVYEDRPVSALSEVVGQLTRAELSVAERAARGLSNRSIAGELFVSVKAVEFHMAHIFQKLDLSNRTQLAALFAGPGPRLVPHPDTVP